MNHALRLRSVSRTITSASHVPIPGPPLRDREGRMRFWRASAPPMGVCDGVDGPATGSAVAEARADGPSSTTEVTVEVVTMAVGGASVVVGEHGGVAVAARGC